MMITGLIELMCRHKNASNLLMLLMLLLGVYGLNKLNRQVMPDFGLDVIQVSVQWPGAGSQDVENNIVEAIEPELRFLHNVKHVRSVASEELATFDIKYYDGANMSKALTDVESAIGRIGTLPSDIEKPVITQTVSRDIVLSLEVSGPFSEQEIKTFARRIRDELLLRGLKKVEIIGSRDKEIFVEVSDSILTELDLTLMGVSNRIAQTSVEMPAGSIQLDGMSRQIRSYTSVRSVDEIGNIEVKASSSGHKVYLKDIAVIDESFAENQPSRFLDGRPSVMLRISQSKGEDSIHAYTKVRQYLKEMSSSFPPALIVTPYEIRSSSVQERMDILLSNSVIGLILVISVLFLFLSGKVAFWVAAGIPISIMASLGIMALMGLSLNIISIFALIMGLGLIVDDAIVVGEQVASLHAQGLSRIQSVLKATKMMLMPIVASSLTTIVAFFPLLLIGGAVGQIQSEMPKTMIAIILASFIECFFILPAHLMSSLPKSDVPVGKVGWRERFNRRFDAFRDGPFRRCVEFCFRERYATVFFTLGALAVTVTMLLTGRVGFDFFPKVEPNILYANIAFSAGGSRGKTIVMLEELERAAYLVEGELTQGEESLIKISIANVGQSGGRRDILPQKGDHLGNVQIELVSSKSRKIRTADFMRAWQQEVRKLPGLVHLAITTNSDNGPPGRDIDIRIYGADLDALKAAVKEAKRRVAEIPGVMTLEDDLPFGKEEISMTLTPAGQAMGFTAELVSSQVRNAYGGVIAKRFSEDQEEVLVKVRLSEGERNNGALGNFYLDSPSRAPLSEVVSFSKSIGFAQITREDGIRQVSLLGDIDRAVTTPSDVLKTVDTLIGPQISSRYGVHLINMGSAAEQREAEGDIKMIGVITIAAIYIILAWVLASYSRPLLVMAIIPFGIVGAILGHWVLDFNMSLFSVLGLLGLTGVVVNDSIILLTTIKRKEEEGADLTTAALKSVQERMRPVFLTTLTTIGGLLPLIFETASQAVLIKPLAITMVFGLLVSTVLVLIFLPAVFGVVEDFKLFINNKFDVTGQKNSIRKN
jgi:multidrug efflux pump subunit AcrB